MLRAPIEIANRPASPVWVEFWEVQSETRPGVAYVVARKRDGTWGCDCPAWIFKRGAKGDCKHIQHVIRYKQRPDIFSAPVQSMLTPEKIEKAMTRFALVEVD